MSQEETEITLFTILVTEILDQGGFVQIAMGGDVMGTLSKMQDKYGYTEGGVSDNLSWQAADNAIRYLMMTAKMRKTSIDNAVFYPEHSTTGVTWRGLKADMPFLRIALLKDRKILSSIVDRISSIIFTVKEPPTGNPTLN